MAGSGVRRRGAMALSIYLVQLLLNASWTPASLIPWFMQILFAVGRAATCGRIVHEADKAETARYVIVPSLFQHFGRFLSLCRFAAGRSRLAAAWFRRSLMFLRPVRRGGSGPGKATGEKTTPVVVPGPG
jgi:hypothetical protein